MFNIKIKKTVKEDSKLFYQLRNNTTNRKFFLNSKNIKFDDHKYGLRKILKKIFITLVFIIKKKLVIFEEIN